MQSLLQQNRRLKQIMSKCEQEIIQIKKIGQDHEQQIDNLLKFNQRLLSIIENQMPNKALSRTSSGSHLHPIDETHQKHQKEHQNITIPHRFTNQPHPIKDKVEHVDVQEIQRLSQQNDHQNGNNDDDDYNKHVNLPITVNQNAYDHQSSSDGFRFINAESYSSRPTDNKELSSGRNSTQRNFQNVIYRQEKQSLIDIPKLFKLQKGLNQHYTKELFQSIEQLKRPSNGIPPRFNPNPNSRKQSIPSQASQMCKISQAVTQRIQFSQEELSQQFKSIRQLIHEYKQDFNTEEYHHLCTIIKNDLENDLQDLMTINLQNMKFYSQKEKQVIKLKQNIAQFSPIQKLVQIMRKLNISEDTERMIVEKVYPQQNQNSKSNVSIKLAK